MRLILSTQYPRNSTYSTESGQILYKVDNPFKWREHVATIRKAVLSIDGVSWQAPEISHSSKDNSEPDVENDTGDLPAFEGNFAFYAQVEFHSDSAQFRYDGRDVSTKEYFRKEGWSSYGRDRVFKASDGKEYRWELRGKNVEMVINDKSKKTMVKYRDWRPSFGRLFKGRPASLEVDPSCEPILDEIIMTFVFCHKLWEDQVTGASSVAVASVTSAATAAAVS